MKLLTTKNSLFLTLFGILLITGACGGSSGSASNDPEVDPEESSTITACTTTNICVANGDVNAGEVCYGDVNISVSGTNIAYELNCPDVGCINCDILSFDPSEIPVTDCTDTNICKVLIYRGELSVFDQHCQLGGLQISAEENGETIYDLDCNLDGCLDCSDVF